MAESVIVPIEWLVDDRLTPKLIALMRELDAMSELEKQFDKMKEHVATGVTRELLEELEEASKRILAPAPK